MMKNLASFACSAVLALACLPAAAQLAPETGTLVVEFQGPGGHSSSNYGRTSALHAAGRSLQALRTATLPAGSSYVVTGLRGGNSVNSIASDGVLEILVSAPDQAGLKLVAAQVEQAAKAAADAENAFRGVKEGDLTAGAPAHIRYTVTIK